MQSTYRNSMSLDQADQRSGFELRGILVLLICGFYAVLLFLMASLIRWTWSLVPSPVSSLKCNLSYSDSCKTETKKDSQFSYHKSRKEANHG